jgi:hypothetical protein
MRKLDGIEVKRIDGKETSADLKIELLVLLESFDICVNGFGLPEHALAAARLLADFLKRHTLICKPGVTFPEWGIRWFCFIFPIA